MCDKRLHKRKYDVAQSKERPFQCKNCGKTFNRRSNMNVQMRILTENLSSALSVENNSMSKVTGGKHVISHGGKKTSEYDEMNCDTGTPLTFQQDQLNMCPLTGTHQSRSSHNHAYLLLHELSRLYYCPVLTDTCLLEYCTCRIHLKLFFVLPLMLHFHRWCARSVLCCSSAILKLTFLCNKKIVYL